MIRGAAAIHARVGALRAGEEIRCVDLIPSFRSSTVHQALSRLCRRGVLERVSRGVYRLPQPRAGADLHAILQAFARR